MKKRLLSVFLALCMALTLVPTAWAVDGDPGGESYSPGTIHINVGEEITLLGTEAESGHKWGIYQGSAGYDVSGLEIISGEDSESTYTVTVRASKAGDYGVRHYYTITDPDAPPLLQTQSKSEYFRIKVSDPEPTVADIEVYTNYVNDAADTLPDNVASAKFTYLLEYHGTSSPGGPVTENEFATIQMQATLTAANTSVPLTVNGADLERDLIQGYYTIRYENVANSDAGSEVHKDEAVYFLVTGRDDLEPDGAIQFLSSGGDPITNTDKKYSTITLNAGVFADVATEDPDPEEPASDLTLAVGETKTLEGDQPAEDETPEWVVTSGEGVIELVPDTNQSWKATVTGLAEGEAEVTYYTNLSSRLFTVTVTAADPGEDEDPEVGEDCVAYIVREPEIQEYTDLQTALDEAENGETVVLCKDLTDVAVTVETPNLTLDLAGFEISGQKHPESEAGSSGTDPQPASPTPAAITIGSNATGSGEADQPQVGSFTLKDGTVSVGTGLRLYDDLTTLTVESVIFEDNVASNALQETGGAAVCWRASDRAGETVSGTSAKFVDCQFLNNKSEYLGGGDPNGGAVDLSNVAEVRFTGCIFTGNSSTGTDSVNSITGTGGAVYLDYCGSVSFDDCDFSENSADSLSGGGAVYMQINGAASFTDCTFTENEAPAGAGGAIGIIFTGSEGSSVTVSGCTFTGNTALSGGALWLYGSLPVELTNNTIQNNTATGYGGAILMQTGTNAVLTGDVSDNHADNYGGAIYCVDSTLEVNGNLTGNTSNTSGGAVYCTGSSELTVKGNLSQNKADADGGAIYAKWTQDSATLAVSRPEISITGNVTENSCTRDGGAVYSNIANITVNGTVTGNTAGGSGGGVYSFNGAVAYYSSTVDLTGASVYNNTAETAGADIYHDGGTLTISPVGEDWTLDDCRHPIDGWYTDAADARWSDDTPTEAFGDFTGGVATITEQTALIAAHGADPVEPEPEPAGDVTLNKEASGLKGDETNVTLTVGAKEGQTVSDVVFVLDKSVSVDIRESAVAMLKELMTRAGENRIKVGVVVFNKSVYEELPLTDLNETNYKTIEDALMEETSSGTNIYAGLMAGKEMLDADSSVAPQAKHLVLVTDGVTYLWGAGRAEDGSDILTIYSEQSGNMEESINAGNDMMGAHHSPLESYWAEFQDMAQWMTAHGTDYAADIVTYQHVYGAGQYDPDDKGQGTNSTYENAGFEDGDYIPGESLTGHACANDAAVYMAATAWQEIVEAGYQAYAYAEQDYAETYPWGSDWVENLEDLGGTSGAVPENVTGMFDAVESLILYAIQRGTINDVIGDDFDLTDKNEITADTFTLTIGGVEQTAALAETANTVNFGTADENGVYPYVLTYYPGGVSDDAREQFDLEIHVPVENAEALQLTYSLTLVNRSSTEGTHTVPTNEEATLTYESTDGGERSEPFPKPEVSYTVGDNTITITPADITIYMGGNDGYEAVVGDDDTTTGDTTATNSLPRPMFLVTAPTDVDPADLKFVSSETFTGSDGVKYQKTWTLELAGTTGGDNPLNLYYMKALYATQGQDEVRVQFTREDDPTAGPIVSDNFDPAAEKEMFVDYTIELYTGAVQTGGITVTDEDGNTYELGELDTGTLRVRAVDDTEDDQNPVTQVTTTVTEKVAAGEGAVTAPAGTSYTLNNTTVPVTGTGVGLLFDGIIDDSTANRTQALKDRVDETMGEPGSRTTRHYQAQYLDLVDADNGNAWVMANKSVTVYWGYPSGTDSGDDFTLYHFKNLHRDDNGGLSGFDINEVDQAVMEKVEITKEQYGITFEVPTGGFSPFVLVWETRSGGGGHYDPPDDDDDDTPSLNTKDHVAYVIGYPEDYVTGEPTDDASRWPVKPQGNITRAEVATIFFRLLTDDARDTYWSQSNPYSDVELEKWFNNAISTLSSMEIIEGYEDGTFQPNAPITRAEFTTMAVRFFDYADETYDDSGFTDVEPGMWYTDFINAAVELGLIEGYPDGTFRPNAPITRAEACTLVNRTLGREPHEDHLLPRREMNTWPDNPTNAWYYEAIQEATNSHDYNWTSEDGERVENWTEKLEERDWAELERAWSDAHDAPGGEVMD